VKERGRVAAKVNESSMGWRLAINTGTEEFAATGEPW